MASANKMIGINNDSQSQIDTGVTNSNAQSAAQKDLSVFAALALSVVSSVSIVIVNKYLISTLGFQYVTFLTAMHMIVTAVALRFAAKYNFVEPKESRE